jgi:hypothetical protein
MLSDQSSLEMSPLAPLGFAMTLLMPHSLRARLAERTLDGFRARLTASR